MPLPPQVSPPRLSLTETAPSRVAGVGIVAVAVLAAGPEDDGPSLGPGAAELAEDSGLDLLELLGRGDGTGEAGEVTELPVTAPSSANGSAPVPGAARRGRRRDSP